LHWRKLVKIAVLSWVFLVFFMPIGHGADVVVTESREIIGNTHDGRIQGADTNYADCWNSVTGTVDDGNPIMGVGQLIRTTYRINRLFLFFDTTSIASGANVTDAQLSLYFWSDKSDTDFNVTVQTGATNYPHEPLQSLDFDRTKYSGNGGVWDTSSYTSAQYYNISLNADGRGWIQPANYTSFCLRSSRDIAGTQPSGFENMYCYGADTYSYSPPYPIAPTKLYVTYSYIQVEPEPPSASTDPSYTPPPVIDIPEIVPPKIPSFGYWLIGAGLAVVAIGAVVARKPRTRKARGAKATRGGGSRGVRSKVHRRPRNLKKVPKTKWD
jgi:hypothetical protein